VSDERNEEIPPWHPPEDVRELIRAAREAPVMTREEEDRAVSRAQAAVAAMRAAARPARPAPVRRARRWAAVTLIAAVAVAAVAVLWVWLTPPEVETMRSPDDAASGVARGSHTPRPTASTTASARPRSPGRGP
jgi:ferric-dicitrate binding protein FerR (iron transport regulator)